MRAAAPAPPCDGTADLINVNTSRDVVVRNTEARSGLDKGIKAISSGSTAAVQVYDSWVHHNYRGNVQSSGSSQISVTNSVIEFAGRRFSDNTSVDPEAIGMVGNQGRINSTRNVIVRFGSATSTTPMSMRSRIARIPGCGRLESASLVGRQMRRTDCRHGPSSFVLCPWSISLRLRGALV